MALKRETVKSPDGRYTTYIWTDDDVAFEGRLVRVSNMAISAEVTVKGETVFNDLLYVDTIDEARDAIAKFYHEAKGVQ